MLVSSKMLVSSTNHDQFQDNVGKRIALSDQGLSVSSMSKQKRSHDALSELGPTTKSRKVSTNESANVVTPCAPTTSASPLFLSTTPTTPTPTPPLGSTSSFPGISSLGLSSTPLNGSSPVITSLTSPLSCQPLASITETSTTATATPTATTATNIIDNNQGRTPPVLSSLSTLPTSDWLMAQDSLGTRWSGTDFLNSTASLKAVKAVRSRSNKSTGSTAPSGSPPGSDLPKLHHDPTSIPYTEVPRKPEMELLRGGLLSLVSSRAAASITSEKFQRAFLKALQAISDAERAGLEALASQHNTSIPNSSPDDANFLQLLASTATKAPSNSSNDTAKATKKGRKKKAKSSGRNSSSNSKKGTAGKAKARATDEKTATTTKSKSKETPQPKVKKRLGRKATSKKTRKFACVWAGCGESFPTQYSLKRHYKRHRGDRPHPCTVEGCNARFAEKSTLQRHLQMHSGLRPFQCKYEGCGRRYDSRW